MTQLLDEVALVRAAQLGDRQAFNRLVDRYERMVQQLAYRMLGDGETARDLAQEAILQAYLSLGKLHHAEQFQSWLYGIALNVCRSYRRHRRMNFLSLDGLAGGLAFDALPFSDPAPDPQTVVETRELHACVLAAVEALSPGNRQATLLFYYEEMSLKEIATLLGISVAAVKGRLHKSRRQLRDQLAALVAPGEFPSLAKGRTTIMIPVTITDVVTHPDNDNQVVILTDEAGEHLLPIWIGPFEAEAIALQLMQIHLPRPLTYEFTARLLGAAGAQLEEVRIEAIRESTFYAVVKLRSGEQIQEIDARPSDALALALRTNTPILVAPEVMDSNGIPIPPAARQKSQKKGIETRRLKLDEMKTAFTQAEGEKTAAQRQAENDAAQQRLTDYLFSAE